MRVGDPKHQGEVFDGRFQEVSTRGMGMQIPHCLVSEVSVQDSDRGAGTVCSGDPAATVRMEEGRDPSGQCADRPHPSGAIDTAEVCGFRAGGVSERQECDQDLRSASGAQATVLGTAFLGERILCEHSGSGRGADPQICALAVEERSNHGSAQAMEEVI
jgi:hypothetical protein